MAAPAFNDHFSTQAAAYARYRPHYPEALYAYLATCTEGHERAWDCGTGNGQAAHNLTAHYTHIVATDPSAKQIAHARPHERITYRVEPAEHTTLADASIDLVTVAQALHWFDFEGFFAEVRRVLKPGGILAAWTYGLLRIAPAIDAVIDRYYDAIIGPYWPPERLLVEAAYQTIPFPFLELEAPPFHYEADWSQEMLVGYLGTWSATARFKQQHSTDPVDQIREALAEAWGTPEVVKTARWTIPMRIGRV